MLGPLDSDRLQLQGSTQLIALLVRGCEYGIGTIGARMRKSARRYATTNAPTSKSAYAFSAVG